ncbi:hypothetical protein [Xylanimonas protaetiae]|uniref:Uncharacterized protein n=1 Tax=Xylanimonas protaetiae TaxID=2509457 RepID=A0A4P6F7H5_9MICO|nr:hypothetical protein [Xylanimonas protaetiae]QAY69207.1 hypothetical protein ET471_03430 [Xylanimonas protaetiae]
MDDERRHVDEPPTVLAVHEPEPQHLDGHGRLAEEVDGVEHVLVGVLADDDEAHAGAARLRARDGHGVVELGDVALERGGTAAVERGELRARHPARGPGVVERAGQRGVVQAGDELDDDGRAGRVEREQVRLVGAVAGRHGEDLLAEQPVDVRLDDAVGRRADAGARPGDDLRTVSLDLEERQGIHLRGVSFRRARSLLRARTHTLRAPPAPQGRSTTRGCTDRVKGLRRGPGRAPWWWPASRGWVP